jgi:hypothetical protein
VAAKRRTAPHSVTHSPLSRCSLPPRLSLLHHHTGLAAANAAIEQLEAVQEELRQADVAAYAVAADVDATRVCVCVCVFVFGGGGFGSSVAGSAEWLHAAG